MNRYTFYIGDYSRDGHNQSDQFIVATNKTAHEIRTYDELVKTRFGFYVSQLCGEYEEATIPNEWAAKLDEAGVFDLTGIEKYDGYLQNGEFSPQDYEGAETMLRVQLALYQTIDPTFEWKIEPFPPAVSVAVPGYGLY